MFLAAVMVFGLLPVNAFAAEEIPTESTAPAEGVSPEETFDAEVAAVQAMIDALATIVATEEEAAALEEQIAAVDDAMAELYTEQSAQLDYTRYCAAVAALEEFWAQDYGVETLDYEYEVVEKSDEKILEIKDGKLKESDLLSILGQKSVQYRIKPEDGDWGNWNDYNVFYESLGRPNEDVFLTNNCTLELKFVKSATYTVKIYHNITNISSNIPEGGIKVNDVEYHSGTISKVYASDTVEIIPVEGYEVTAINCPLEQSGAVSLTYTLKNAQPRKVTLEVEGAEYGSANLSVESGSDVAAGTNVTLTATPNTSSNSAVAYYVASTEISGAPLTDNTFTVGSEDIKVKVTFSKRSIEATNGAVKINGYYEKQLNKEAFSTLKSDILTAAGLIGEGGVYTASDYKVELNAAGIYHDLDDLKIGSYTTLFAAIAVPETGRTVRVTLKESGNLPEVSTIVTMDIEESRSAAGLVSKTLDDLNYNSADEIQAYVEAAAASSEVNPHGLNVTVEKTGGEIPSVAGTCATLTYTVSFKENDQYLSGSCDLAVTVTGNYSACTVIADSSVTAGGSMSVNGSSNGTAPGNSTVTVVVTPSGSNAVETITVTNTTTGEQVTTSAIGYENKAATVTFTSGGASGAEAYVVSATYSEARLSLKDGQTITYCIDNDKVNVNLKELVFNAVYDSSNPALKSGDVTVEYAYAGAMGYNLWASVTEDPAYIGHKFGEDGSETIRVTYQSEKYGELEAQVGLNVFDSCYNNTIEVQTKAPEGVKADFSVDYSVDGREYQKATCFKQDTEMSVTLTPSGGILEVLGQIYNGTYSDSVAYIKSVTVKVDGKEIDATVSRGQGGLLDGNLYNATVTFTTASNTNYTIIAEYGVLDMNAKQGDVTLEMYQGGMNYHPEVPSAEEIFNAVIGDCSDDFLEKYENMTVGFSTDLVNYTWKDVTDENLLALEDGTTIRVRVTWKGEPYTYYPVAITKDVTLKDQRTPVTITGTIPTEEVEFVEESQLLESLKAVLGVEILADGNVLEDAPYAMTYELSGDEESGIFANVTVTYDGTAEYKPGAKTFENVPIADIPDNATVHVEILNASAVITNQADIAQNAVDDVYTVRGNSEYTFKFTPIDGYAIERVSVNGAEVRLAYDDQVLSFAMALAEKENYEVVVETVPSQFELKDERIYGFAPGWETPENAQIVDAVVAGPEDLNVDEVKVEYLARSEGTAQITIPEIVILEGIWSIPASTLDIELGELWLDPTAEINEVDLEKIVDALVVELFDKVKSGELSLNEVSGYVERYIRGLTLNAHAFGANGDGSTEIIRISYEDDKYLIAETRTDVTIHDDRVPTVLAASDCEVSYGYSLSQLLAASGAAVTAEGAAVSGTAIKTNDLYLHAGEEAQKVTLYFSGNEQYQPCEVTINVTVKKAAASIDYDSQIVTYGDAYDFTLGVTPTVMPDGTAADIQILEFMIGLDMHTLLDVDIGDKEVGLDQPISHIQIRLPESIRESVVGKYLQGEMSLGEFADLVESMGDMFGMSEESVSAFGQIIEAITGVTDSMEIKVILSADHFEPRNIGVYIAGAVTIDSDFETAYTADYLIITPATAECELAWNHTDSNGIMTLPAYQEYYCEMMGAHVVENVQTGMTGETLATANDHIKYLILAVNDDNGEFLTTDVYGNIKANIYVNLEDIQNNGAYVQIAYMLNWGNEICYAMPIVRSFLITPSTVKVTFVDESGAENPHREFTYDGSAKSIGEIVITNQDGAPVVIGEEDELTVTYIGVDSTGKSYNSPNAPVNAGVYGVVVTFKDNNEDGTLISIGSVTGVMVIHKAELSFDLKDTTRTYNGEEQFVAVENPENADYLTVIVDRKTNTANILLEDDAEELIALLEKTLGYELPDQITLAELRRAVQDALDTIKGYEISAQIAAIAAMLPTDVQQSLAQLLEKDIKPTLEELKSVLKELNEELPESATITINAEKPVNVGTYEFDAIAISANYKTEVSQGILTIEPAKVEVTVADVEKTYGEADPELTYTIAGLIGEDKLDVKLSRAEGENVGNYVITATVEKNDNYNIDVASGILTITERTVSVKLDSYTVIVGDALPVWTYTVTAGEVVRGDTLKLAIACDAKNTNTAGIYTITAVDNDPNYAITVTGGTLTVQQKQEDTDDHEGYYPIEFDPKQDSTGTIVPGGTVEVDGAPYVLDENCTAWVPNTDAKLVTTYKYKVGDSHYQTYPTNMYVWFLTITDSDGDGKADQYSAGRVKELDDFFKYEGTSIRVNSSSNGIRFFTSVPADACQQLMNGKLLTGSLSGYQLVQAGTLYTRWRGAGSCLTLDTGISSDVYGGKAGNAFRVFSKVGNRNWYTGVLTGLDGDADTLGMDILSRPFVTLERDGEQLILYGGTVQRSIYYVAVQNRNYWAVGTAYDNFIEGIIATVEPAR